MRAQMLLTAVMARKTVVTLTDDLDGSEASKTVTFAVDGASYELDLSDKNAAKFEKALAPFVAAGRKVRNGQQRRKSPSSGVDVPAVRAWAKANGYEVSNRGRVSAEIVAAYNAG
jgi:hypothetical protein